MEDVKSEVFAALWLHVTRLNTDSGIIISHCVLFLNFYFLLIIGRDILSTSLFVVSGSLVLRCHFPFPVIMEPMFAVVAAGLD